MSRDESKLEISQQNTSLTGKPDGDVFDGSTFAESLTKVALKSGLPAYGNQTNKFLNEYKETRNKPAESKQAETLLLLAFDNAIAVQQLAIRIRKDTYTWLRYHGYDTVEEVANLLHAAVNYMMATKNNKISVDFEILPMICTAIVITDIFRNLYILRPAKIDDIVKNHIDLLSGFVQSTFIEKGISGLDVISECLEAISTSIQPGDIAPESIKLQKTLKEIASNISVLLGDKVFDEPFQPKEVRKKVASILGSDYREARWETSTKNLPALKNLLLIEFEKATTGQHLITRIKGATTGLLENGMRTARQTQNLLDAAVTYVNCVKMGAGITPDVAETLPAICTTIVAALIFTSARKSTEEKQITLDMILPPSLQEQLEALDSFMEDVFKQLPLLDQNIQKKCNDIMAESNFKISKILDGSLTGKLHITTPAISSSSSFFAPAASSPSQSSVASLGSAETNRVPGDTTSRSL